MIDELKPYPEYKDSRSPWLGMLPAHWDVRRLRHTVDMMVSNIDKHTQKGEQPVRLCNYVDVYKNEKITERLNFMRATASKEEIARFTLRLGDVVITKDSEIWTDIGVPALVEYTASDFVCGYHLAILRPRREMLMGAFLLRALQSPGVAAQFHVGANGVTRYGLSHADIKNALVPVPPRAEQAAIVRFLDHANGKIERAIRAKKKLIALLNEQKQAVIHRIVTGGLDPNVKLKPSCIPWLGSVPVHWDEIRLKFLVKRITDGEHISPRLTNNRIPLLSAKDIRDRKIVYDVDKFVTLEQAEQFWRRCHPERGDILIVSRGATIGRIGVVESEMPFCLMGSVILCKTITGKCSAEYLYYSLNAHHAQTSLWFASASSAQPAIYIRDVAELRLPMPPLSERVGIVEYLEESLTLLNAYAARTEREIELLREYRTTLTADVVTGKLDVRETVAHLPAETETPLAGDDLPDDIEDEGREEPDA